MPNDQLPGAGGNYVLVLELKRARLLTVGRLGKVTLAAGRYAYVGSALGSGGLRGRIGRHLRGGSKPHWHIDYLRLVASVVDCLYTLSDEPLECAWAQALEAQPGAMIPVPGFGSSDCRAGCPSHLIAFPGDVNVNKIRRVLRSNSPLYNFSICSSHSLHNPVR